MPNTPLNPTPLPGTDVVPIPVQFQTTRQALRDLLCTAIEGGANYWAAFSEAKRTGPGGDYLSVRVLCEDGAGQPVSRLITETDLIDGLTRLTQNPKGFQHGVAMKHFMDAVGDPGSTGDATTADVVLQMVVFGEVIYG